MKYKNQRGFGAVEIILIVAVIGLIGAVGYLVFIGQTGINQSANTNTTESNVVASVDEAVVELDGKITELSVGKYKLEKLEPHTGEIEVSQGAKMQIQLDKSLYYRSDPVGTNYDYEEYRTQTEQTGTLTNEYAANTLGLNKVHSYEATGPTGDVFKTTVYKVGDYYVAFKHGNGFFYVNVAKAS